VSDSPIESANSEPLTVDAVPILTRIGHVTRALHDNLGNLGFDKILEQVATDIPDARDRLNYVARMTEQAAVRVLNATDLANPLQDEMAKHATDLKQSWSKTLTAPSLKSEYNAVAEQTLEFVAVTEKNTEETKALLMEIMMAQDFQDLTGQVIKRITALAQDIEQQLVQVLIDFSPEAIKKQSDSGLMNGPQIDPHNTQDVVATQAQVDDLLDSLGF
jgi:chemotaxis protein CheZ